MWSLVRLGGLVGRLCAATALLLTAGAASAAPRAFEFDVTWSLFPELTLAKGRFVINEQRGEYLLGLEAEAKLTAPPIDWRGYLAAEGQSARGERTPTRFERSSIRPTERELIIVSWDGEGKPVTAISRTPLIAAIERERVDPSSIRNVVDPLTFLAIVLDQVEKTNGDSCDVTRKTWDGQRLAEIEIRTIDRLKAARVDCRIIYNRIVGLRKDTPFRVDEETTTRLVRFEKTGGVWEPRWIRIDANVIGMQTTFTTNIRPGSGGFTGPGFAAEALLEQPEIEPADAPEALEAQTD